MQGIKNLKLLIFEWCVQLDWDSQLGRNFAKSGRNKKILMGPILFFVIWGKSGIIKFEFRTTVKLGNKERFDKEQIGIKELFMDYQPFYTINLLLDKELLPI